MTPSTRVLAVLLILSSLSAISAASQTGAAVGGMPVQGSIQAGAAPSVQPAPNVAGDPASAVTLEGRAVNAITGEPVPRVSITLTIVQTGPRPSAGAGPMRPATFSAATDAQGKFKFEALPPGRYQLTADRTGYVRANYGAEPGRPLKQVAGDPGQKITNIDFKLIPQAIIAGKVVDENGEPVANAPVRVLRLAGYFRQISGGGGGVNTNAIGEFLMGGLAPGRYVLLVDYRPGRYGPGAMAANQAGTESYVPTYYPNATDFKAAGSVILNAGQEVRGIDVWLQKGKLYRISGTVAGIPTAGSDRVQVSLSPEGGPTGGMPPVRSPSSERDGRFVFSAIQPGSYVVAATLYQNNSRPRVLGYTTVLVTDIDVDDVVIQASLAAPVRISGKIKVEGADDSRVAGEVMLEPLGMVNGPGPGTGRIQEDNTFAIENVPIGKYNVFVTQPPEGSYIKRIIAGGADVLASGLDLSQPQALPPLEIIISAKAGTVEGIIKGGEAMRQGAFVTLLPEPLQGQPQRLRRSATADAGGHFSMKGVPPGEYRVYAWQENFPVRIIEPADLVPYESYSVAVSLNEGAQKQVELQVAKPQ